MKGEFIVGEPLFQMSALTDFLKLLIWTGQVAEERPASALLIAPPGAGKTSLLQNLECTHAKFVGDLTSRPFHILLKDDKLTHILLGDMLSIFGHKSSTVALTMQVISKLTGEEMKQDPFTGEEIAPRKIGLLTAIPPEDMERRHIKDAIMGGGFASRFMFVKYTYKPSTQASIHQFIAAGKYVEAEKNHRPFVMQNVGRLKVEVPKTIADLVKDLTLTIKKDPLGFRAHRYLRVMVKAAARRDSRNLCTQKDFETVAGFCDFFTGGKEI